QCFVMKGVETMRQLCNRVKRLLIIGVPFGISGIYVASAPVEAIALDALPVQSVSITPNQEVPIKVTEPDWVDIPSDISSREMPEFSDPASSRKYLVNTAHPGGTMT